MNGELPSSHPFASEKGQWKAVAGLGWRWVVSGLVGSLFDLPILSFFLAMILYFFWLRPNFSAEYYAPYAEKNMGVIIWLVRAVFLAFCAVGLLGWRGEPQESFFVAWAGISMALFIESFFSIKYLTLQETEK